MNLIQYEMTPGAYGQVRFFPLLLANETNTNLEEWFTNYKFLHFSTSRDIEEEFNAYHLNIEFVYGRRIRDRPYGTLKSDVTRLIDYCQFQELFRILVETLEIAYQMHQIAVGKRAGTTVEDFRRLIESKRKAFHGLPFPKKIKRFKVNGKNEEFLEALIAISKARNCLEHRTGIVGPQDCNRGNKLILVARHPALLNKAGKSLSIFDQTDEEKLPPIEFIREELKFREGERITIGFNESYKIIYNINFALKGIIDWIYECCNCDEQGSIIKQFRD